MAEVMLEKPRKRNKKKKAEADLPNDELTPEHIPDEEIDVNDFDEESVKDNGLTIHVNESKEEDANKKELDIAPNESKEDPNEQTLETQCRTAAHECFISFVDSAVQLLEAPNPINETVQCLQNTDFIDEVIINGATQDYKQTYQRVSEDKLLLELLKDLPVIERVSCGNFEVDEELNDEPEVETPCLEPPSDLEDLSIVSGIIENVITEIVSDSVENPILDSNEMAIDDVTVVSDPGPGLANDNIEEEKTIAIPALENVQVKSESFNGTESHLPSGSKVKENAKIPLLKASVFVGSSNLYTSSLEISSPSWDRTKYNLVLLPDLSKIVYPDPDLNKDPLPIITRTVDRSNKPDLLHKTKHQANTPEHKLLTIIEDSETVMQEPIRESILPTKNLQDKIEAMPRSIDADFDMKPAGPYTDICGTVDFRIFMNPVRWDPSTKVYQTVLFQVGGLYYQKTFYNCRKSQGLLAAITKRAEELSQTQLTLANKCLLAHKSESFNVLAGAGTVVIYEDRDSLNFPSEKIKIHFGVNEAFYHQVFFGCKDFEDLVTKVKERAARILFTQYVLKRKANDPYDTYMSSLENMTLEALNDFECDDPDPDESHDIPVPEKEAPRRSSAMHSIRRKWNSMRNWFRSRKSKSGPVQSSSRVLEGKFSREPSLGNIRSSDSYPSNI